MTSLRRDEFERELHVGSVTGIRAFRVDSLGRLRPANWGSRSSVRVVDTIFTPGENVAQCGHRKDLPSEEAHGPGRFDVRDCMCGFYSYHSLGSDEVHVGSYGNAVIGVVSCWGLVTVGDKGMRATRCKVEALVLPGNARSRFVHDHRIGIVTGLLLFGAPAFVYGLASYGFWSNVSFIAGLLMLVLGAYLSAASGLSSSDSIDPELAARVRRNYPDVPVYASVKKMLKRHPLSFGDGTTMEGLDPDTDPEFWTRKASV